LSYAAEEIFQANLGAFPVPGANALTSFDISWVDTQLVNYFLADRSNAQIVSIPIEALAPSFSFNDPKNPFAGNVPAAQCADGAANDCSGPNGVLSFFNTNGVIEVWAGDGPTLNTACQATPCSTVRVFTTLAATPTAIINTGGHERSDEMCFDPKDHVMMVANDADTPPFVTFISTALDSSRFSILAKISLPDAVGGIEQCAWNPQAGVFYLNTPLAAGGDQILIFNPTNFTHSVQKTVDPNECMALRGLDVRRDGQQLIVGCNAVGPNGQQNSLIINANGTTAQVLRGAGGSDQVWSDKQSDHYFIASGQLANGTAQLGIYDAFATQSNNPDPPNQDFGVIGSSVFLAFRGSTAFNVHSVAAFSGTVAGLPSTWTLAFVPIPAVGGTPAPFSSTMCVGAFTTPARGCIGIVATSPERGLSEEASE
jgi:hypothetical protein